MDSQSEVWGAAFSGWIWAWLAFAVLGAGLLLWLASLGAPLRGLAVAWRSRADVSRQRERPLAIVMAAAAGMGGITGSGLAIAAAGPGALPWMWIAIAAGMGVAFAEGALGSRAHDGPAQLHLSRRGLGQLVTPLYALSILAVAVLGGAMLQTNQASAVLAEAMWTPLPAASLGLTFAAIVFVYSASARRLLLDVVPLALVLFAVCAATIAFSDVMLLQLRLGDAFNAAFALEAVGGGTTGGVVAVAVHHGVLRATLAGDAGLGTAGLANVRAPRPAAAGSLTMLVPVLTAGVIGTLSALVLLTGTGAEALASVEPAAAPQPPDADANPDDPTTAPEPEGMARAPRVATPRLIPLEQTFSEGLRPSQQVGQTIVIPEDAGLAAGEHYAMLLRSNPRGHPTAKFDAERNAVILPAWTVTTQIDEVIFHADDDEKARQAGWDVRIPCDREVRAPRGGSKAFLKLTPKDPDINLSHLITKLQLDRRPFVPLSDFHFTGRVAEASSPNLGPYLAMYEPPQSDRPFNPKLHEFFRNDFRGPYADDDGPRPPFAFVTEPGYTPQVGSIVRLALQAAPRGEPLLSVTRGGTAEGPPWSFLMNATEIVLQHDADPSKDVIIPVTARLTDFRIRFDVADPRYEDLNRIAPGWTGPYVRVPDFTFAAEVRSSARLPTALADRRVLIPVHETAEPQGPYGDQWPYTPHPGDVLAMGMHGPVLAADGAAKVAARFRLQLGPAGSIAIVICATLFALTTIVAWTQLCVPAATALGGPQAAKLMPVVLLAAAAAGAWVSLTRLIAVTDIAIGLAVATNLIGLALALPKVIAAGRALGDRAS